MTAESLETGNKHFRLADSSEPECNSLISSIGAR